LLNFTRYSTSDETRYAFAFVSNFLEYVSAKNWQNWMTSDQVITNIERVTFVLSHSVVLCVCLCFTNPSIHSNTDLDNGVFVPRADPVEHRDMVDKLLELRHVHRVDLIAGQRTTSGSIQAQPTCCRRKHTIHGRTMTRPSNM